MGQGTHALLLGTTVPEVKPAVVPKHHFGHQRRTNIVLLW